MGFSFRRGFLGGDRPPKNNIIMQTKQHNINQKHYEGKVILVTEPQSLDMIIYNHYKDIKLEEITGQSWTAYSDIFTLVLELNPDVNTSEIKEGQNLFMPAPITNSADARIKLWE